MHLNSILETEEERFVKKKTISVIENIKRGIPPFFITRVDLMGKAEEENISDDAQLIYRESMS